MLDRRGNISHLAFAGYMLGDLLFFGAVYGIFSVTVNLWVAAVGILMLLGCVIVLLVTSRPWNLRAPHLAVVGISVAALALHAYECLYLPSTPSMWILLWMMVPFLLCLLLSMFPRIRVAVIAGAAVALALDLWDHYLIFISQQSSTASLGMLFLPLWNTTIVIPIATFIARLVGRWRERLEMDEPDILEVR